MKGVLAGVLVVIVVVGAIACREKASGPVRRVLSGRIAAVGNAPFVKLVLRDRDGETYEIAPEEREKLKELQGVFIVVEADVYTMHMKTADGKYTRKIRLLKSILLIKK